MENTGGALTTYTWDDANKLTGITFPDNSQHSFAYAADGLRRKKETPTETRTFVLDGVNVLQELDAALARVAQYTDFPGTWGGLVSQRRDSTSSFYGFDLQGSARLLASLAQAITDAYLDTAFGEDVASSGTSVNAYRYEGLYRYYRDAAGRLQVGHRILDPEWGRWLSRDPMGAMEPLPQLYTYVGGRPTAYADPSGLGPSPELLEFIGGLILVALGLTFWDEVAILLYRKQIIQITGNQLKKRGCLAGKMWWRAVNAATGTPGGRAPDLKISVANQGQWCNAVDKIEATATYKQKVQGIKQRLRKGGPSAGSVPIVFEETEELRASIHAATLKYRCRNCVLTLSIGDLYNFDRKHIWKKLQDKGYIAPYNVSIKMRDQECVVAR